MIYSKFFSKSGSTNSLEYGIIRYNKSFQSKININFKDYLDESFENNSIDINDHIFIVGEQDNYRYII